MLKLTKTEGNKLNKNLKSVVRKGRAGQLPPWRVESIANVLHRVS